MAIEKHWEVQTKPDLLDRPIVSKKINKLILMTFQTLC